MILYHGTTSANLDSVRKHGLRPRRGNAKDNWPKMISRRGHVYLTDAYALYFAGRALQRKERALVLEVDSDLLLDRRMFPDEDFIGAVLWKRLTNEQRAGTDLATFQGTLDIALYQHEWRQSLARTGSVAYKGSFTLALTRYALVDFAASDLLAVMAYDPAPGMMNYLMMAEEHSANLAWKRSRRFEPLAAS